MKKVILSVGLLSLSLQVFSQVGGLGRAPTTTSPATTTDPTTNPSGVGFGGGTPSGTTTNPDVNIPSPGAVPGDPGFPTNDFQQRQDATTPGRTLPGSPSTFPDTTPAFPNTTPAVPGTVPAQPSIPGERTIPGSPDTGIDTGTGTGTL